jgi:bifunctional DNA-binding transcriptional regulator/antitoxin component of YhaV-PrlF toxin-antitoxin module
MRVTSKGQVTIPQESQNRLGILPYTTVEFELAGDYALMRKAKDQSRHRTRGRRVLEALRGTADARMSTDQIMALTRTPSSRWKRRN